MKKWSKENAESRRRAAKRRWDTDPQVAIKSAIYVNLRRGLNGERSAWMEELQQCSWDELRKHLAAMLPVGANRADYQIDHIKPLASFDLRDEAQLRQACNWKNLRLLTVTENASKHDKYEQLV